MPTPEPGWIPVLVICMVLFRRLVLRAARDFLRGVDFFLETDEEQLNSALITAAPKLLSLTQLDGWQEDMRCDEHILDKRISLPMILTLGGHLIPSFALKKQPSAVPLSRTGAVDCFGKASVIQYQLGGDNGFAAKRSFAKFMKYGFIGTFTAIRLLFGFSRVKNDQFSCIYCIFFLQFSQNFVFSPYFVHFFCFFYCNFRLIGV